VMSLDKVFHCEKIAIKSAHLSNTRQSRRASDHLPLVVDFRMIW